MIHESWLCQLVREFDDVCFQYNVPLNQPVLQISHSKRQLGAWSGASRTISISHFLIMDHPWTVTLQVLKHEMAHQMCCELFHSESTGHGPEFKRACRQIGVEEVFQHAVSDLGHQIAAGRSLSECTENGRRLIEKIRKLLALGRSDNEHEAALAVQRAGEMLARYNLNLSSLALEAQLLHRTINTGWKRMPVYCKAVCTLLQQHFSVRVIYGSIYDPHQDVSFKTVELLGSEENVLTAEHCYYFLENRLQTLWDNNKSSFSGKSRIARKSYFLGLLAGFNEKLAAAAAAMSSEEKTTMKKGAASHSQAVEIKFDKQLDLFIAQRFPRLKRARRKRGYVDRATYEQAVTTGKDITFNKPVQSSTQSGTRLLS